VELAGKNSGFQVAKYCFPTKSVSPSCGRQKGLALESMQWGKMVLWGGFPPVGLNVRVDVGEVSVVDSEGASVGRGARTSIVCFMPLLMVSTTKAAVGAVDVEDSDGEDDVAVTITVIVDVDVSSSGIEFSSRLGVEYCEKSIPCLLTTGPADAPRTMQEAAKTAVRRSKRILVKCEDNITTRLKLHSPGINAQLTRQRSSEVTNRGAVLLSSQAGERLIPQLQP
jgi:hypothetical protein